jgi:uncharacterized tellurite resistance protein B-like protein
MLSSIQRLLGLGGGSARQPESVPTGFSEDARIATVALLHRMTTADFESRGEEQAAVLAAIGRLLGTPPAEAGRLLDEARQHAQQAVSLFDFTQVLHRQLDLGQKREIVELLWSVAFADGELDPQEEHLVRKVARLIHLPDAEFIAAKQRARQAAAACGP